MINLKLDKSKFNEKVFHLKNVQQLDEIELNHVICEMLQENHAKFIFNDEYCDDFGMDCRFDLPCLLDSYEEIINGLQEKIDFSIEFYEPGKEYLLFFTIYDNAVNIILKMGYDEKNIREYNAKYDTVHQIFVNLFDDILISAEKYIENINTNSIFIEWKDKLKQFQTF